MEFAPHLCELADVVRVRILLDEYEEDFLERPDGDSDIEGRSSCSDMDDEGTDEDEGTETD